MMAHRGYRGSPGHDPVPALKGTCQLGETHTDKTLERYEMTQRVSGKALRDGEEVGGQRVERGFFRSRGLPRRGTGHGRDSGPGAASRAVQWE